MCSIASVMTGFLAGGGKCAAGPILLFTSEAGFRAAATIVHTTTFDDIASDTTIGVGTVRIDDIEYVSHDPDVEWVVRDVGIINPPSSPNVFGTSFVIEDFSLSYRDGIPIAALGFHLFVQSATNSFLVTATDSSGERLDLLVTVPIHGSSYLGFTSRAGITSIVIADAPGDNNKVNAWLDDVSYGGIVPEPSSFALVIFGGLAIAVRRLRGRLRRGVD